MVDAARVRMGRNQGRMRHGCTTSRQVIRLPGRCGIVKSGRSANPRGTVGCWRRPAGRCRHVRRGPGVVIKPARASGRGALGDGVRSFSQPGFRLSSTQVIKTANPSPLIVGQELVRGTRGACRDCSRIPRWRRYPSGRSFCPQGRENKVSLNIHITGLDAAGTGSAAVQAFFRSSFERTSQQESALAVPRTSSNATAPFVLLTTAHTGTGTLLPPTVAACATSPFRHWRTAGASRWTRTPHRAGAAAPGTSRSRNVDHDLATTGLRSRRRLRLVATAPVDPIKAKCVPERCC